MAENLGNKLLSLLLGTPSTPEIDNLKRSLAEAIAKSEQPTSPPAVDPQKHGEKLREFYAAYSKKNRFSAGQLVRWKPGLRNRAWPAYEQPGIVVEVLTTPILDEREPVNSTAYREQLDIRVGIYWEPTSEFFVYYFNSDRFEPLIGSVSK